MSLPFYFTFVAACCVFTVGINGQPGTGNSPPPQNFLSSNICSYPPTINCPTNPPFRPMNGDCNVPSSPYYGKSGTPYIRMLPASYINKTIPRNVTFNGGPLPLPRETSVKLFTDTSKLSTTFSTLTAIFARFVEHDLYKTQLFSASSCCTPNQNSGLCDNIKVAADDPFFKTHHKTCLPKGKSVPSTKIDCETGGSTQQINENTHTLDLSNIYGSTKAASDKLRTKKDGLLNVTDTKDLLPKYEFPDCLLPTPNPNNVHCFDAGDRRVNIDPLIMTMYTVWVRHHNAIAKELKYILLNANDETLFQTARKIVIGEYQNIVFNEFLPTLDISVIPITDATSYSAKKNISIYNLFSLVYTELVDSMIPQKIHIDTTDVEMDSFYYTPATLFETDGIKKILEGMQATPAEAIDRHVVKALTDNYLKKTPGSGTDKVALNLQQSRENGAITYPICYRILNKDYTGPLKYIDNTLLIELLALYKNDFNIEFLPGLFCETKEATENYGPTTKKIIDPQFELLKDADPFFYSHGGVFTPKQFDELKTITLAKILCNNGGLIEVLKNALKNEAPTTNEKEKCADINDIDICVWATAKWSAYTNLGCYAGVYISIRHCEILHGGKCTCVGEPYRFVPCPNGLLQNMVTVEKMKSTYYKYFGLYGNPLNVNSVSMFIDNLKEGI